jgi:hypothetical protein
MAKLAKVTHIGVDWVEPVEFKPEITNSDRRYLRKLRAHLRPLRAYPYFGIVRHLNQNRANVLK